ncbi:uncharacterized protein A4U43_C08F13670 [Asparagus officinalis]|nr:uncharacterized protein A4U43_C08F13670 [Asparagus officinalis]
MALVVEEDAVGPNANLEASRHPGKEPIGVDDAIEGRAGTPSNQMENGADGRILEDMASCSTLVKKSPYARGLPRDKSY